MVADERNLGVRGGRFAFLMALVTALILFLACYRQKKLVSYGVRYCRMYLVVKILCAPLWHEIIVELPMYGVSLSW